MAADPATAAAVAAISAVMDWRSSPDARAAAFAYLESVKSGDVRALASTSFLLVRKDQVSEIRLHGFKMLQHLVRLRWEELSAAERNEFANFTINLISEVVGPHEEWALKSQTAALVAEVIRREGVALWNTLLPSIVSLSNSGPIEAELVAMILRWLPEDITVHNEDLEGDRRRSLLRGLTDSLPQILPLLYSLLEKHFVAALNEHTKQQMELAKRHVGTVTAVLNAINAYAEWAPVTDLAKYGLIHGCGSLLSYSDFRLHACEFFKVLCQRKRSVDVAVGEYDAAMSNIFQVLMNISQQFLTKSGTQPSAIDESEYEFSACICETMVALGSSNMQCILADGARTFHFLQQMLEYYQHYRIALHFQSLLFWLVVLREPSKAKSVARVSGDNSASVNSASAGDSSTEKEKKGVSVFVTDEIYSTILDVSLKKMLKNSPNASSGLLEVWSEELEGKSDFSNYRTKLLDLIKVIASQRPVIAAASIVQRINVVFGDTSQATKCPQDIDAMEGAQLGLEAVVSTIFDGLVDYGKTDQETKFQIHSIFAGLLQQLFSIKWTEPSLAVIHGHYLDALGPFLRHYPDAVASVVNKLFELLTSLPITFQDPSNNSRLARLQICSSFIRISRAADKALLPHMKNIADTMSYLQGEGRLLRGEHNHLCEAFLVMTSSAGIQQQQEVLAWLLEPLNKMWTQVEWQTAYLSDPSGLTSMFADSQFMWSIYHTVTFFEKALKRSGTKKSAATPQAPTTTAATGYLHPMSSHLPWILPPLLRLLRCIHALWAEPFAQSQTGEIKAAKSMTVGEQASLLGETGKLTKGQVAPADGLLDAHREGESKENSIRNWLRGIRDSGYNVLGLAATLGEAFFRCIEGPSVTLALMENVQVMEFRHLRQLIHLVIVPFVKFCPAELWQGWLLNLLQPLFVHCQQGLHYSWSSLLHEGRAKVPDSIGNLSGSELKVEVMEEKLLRDLTREVCSVLWVLASPGLNSGLPSLEQLGPSNRMDSSLKDLESFALSSLMGFLTLHGGTALPALRISVEVFTWTDSEAVTKVIPFCGALIHLAVATNQAELRQFVSKDLFSSIIHGLSVESNSIMSAELVGLCREIYIYLSDRDPAPRQVLLSLPHIKQEDLLAFDDSLSKTASPKEQKQHMRSLLLLATGNKLRALAAQKTTNVITNVTTRNRSSTTHHGSSAEDGHIGLAALSQT
ncbi:protein HASTY 1-like [Phragmites australis]|uniref:protein HASTY 1-like n=1 Tax=Phragmites australis TaxID=29695 RepID=UPI002D792438|nr:protein HASTY 1-like [Phragmites australis]